MIAFFLGKWCRYCYSSLRLLCGAESGSLLMFPNTHNSTDYHSVWLCQIFNLQFGVTKWESSDRWQIRKVTNSLKMMILLPLNPSFGLLQVFVTDVT